MLRLRIWIFHFFDKKHNNGNYEHNNVNNTGTSSLLVDVFTPCVTPVQYASQSIIATIVSYQLLSTTTTEIHSTCVQ